MLSARILIFMGLVHRSGESEALEKMHLVNL
jgi:hypothetical protein